MVTKAEKIFFAVVIIFIVGTAVFWKEIQVYVGNRSQTFDTKSATTKKAAREKTIENKPDLPAILQSWELPSILKEISGLVSVNGELWAVSDHPKKPLMKLDSQGKVLQELTLRSFALEDPETLASDGRYLFVGDVGDNKGDRNERKIYRVDLETVKNGRTADVPADIITFSFDGQTMAAKKKENEFDCEAMFFHQNSLYLFTKRRSDKDTEVFQLPATPGKHIAKSLGVFETNGMITGAAINPTGTEVVLTGYHKGHHFPFLLFLHQFTGSDFFNGKKERIELADKKSDWQIESISYAGDERIYFANEGTKDVPATLYSIMRKDVAGLNMAGKK